MSNSLYEQLMSLKEQLAKEEEKLTETYPKKLIDKAEYEHMQQQLKREPKLAILSKELCCFYRALLRKDSLKDLVQSQLRSQLIIRLKTMVLDAKVQQKLIVKILRMRSKQLERFIEPSYLSEFVESVSKQNRKRPTL